MQRAESYFVYSHYNLCKALKKVIHNCMCTQRLFYKKFVPLSPENYRG